MIPGFFLLWLGLFGLILFCTYGTLASKTAARWWLLGSAVLGLMLAVPVMLILVALMRMTGA